ncbi:anti-sigma factor antagonist [Streptomyces ruber]|uniref:Anti-sigma factor antagonist n=3 Tax=Streptomyces TaxID=1883 RepID=A0A918BRG5_9ACTN|nr:anti-sigma factor antagonist [Streptomyces ruber]
MNPLKITRRDTATGPVLHVVGELDYDQADDLRAELDRLSLDAGQCLVVELAGLEYCDSTGITVLLAARQQTRAARADLVLAAAPPHLLRILGLLGLDQVFTLRPDATAATGSADATGTGGSTGTV